MRWLRQRWVRSLFLLLVGIALILGIAYVETGRPARERSGLEHCGENLKLIAAACELYAVHNGGRYPCADLPLETPPALRTQVFLDRMVPQYLRERPSCQAARADTYSGTYHEDEGHHFVVACGGTYHEGARVPANFPRYDSRRGLRERPDDDERVDRAVDPASERLDVSVGDLAPGLTEQQARERGAKGTAPVLTWAGGRVFVDRDGQVRGVSADTLRNGQGRLHAGWPRTQVEDELGPPRQQTWQGGICIATYEVGGGKRLDVIYERDPRGRQPVRTFVLSDGL